MNVALISVQYYGTVTGGGGIHVINLSKALAKKGVDVTVLSMGIGDLPDREEIENEGNLIHVRRFWTRDSRCLENPFEGSKFDEITRLREFKEKVLRYLMRNRDFDAVHLHGHFIIPSLARDLKEIGYNAKIITTFHALESVSETLKGPIDKKIYDLILKYERDALMHSDVIIFLSKSMIDDIARIHGREILNNADIRIIPNGVDPLIINYERSLRNISEFREKIGTDYLIFNLNRIDPSKKIEFIINSLPLIYERKKRSTSLLIAGKMENRNIDYREKLVAISNRIMQKWPNIVIRIEENIPDYRKILYYDAADVFVTASPIEPFGMTILEAIVRGTPIAVVDAPGPREIFSIKAPFGDAFIELPVGVIVRFGNEKEVIENLANAIVYLLEKLDYFRKKVRDFKQIVISKYSWESVAERIYDVYKDP